MASTFSQTLRLELIGDGDQSGIWGQTTNTNLGTLLEQAITGVVNITMTDANYTLTNFNGVSDEARNAVLVVGGTNAAVRDIIAPVVEKLYIVRNSTVGGFGVRIIGATGTGVTVPNGATVWVYCDGTNFNAVGTESVGNFEVNGNLTVTGNTNAVAATYTGNVAALNISTANVAATGNVSAANFSTTGNVAATGNVSAANFIGAGLTLTSINASNISAGTIANARTTASSANGASTIVTRDASGDFSARTITANLTGTASATSQTNFSNLTIGGSQVLAASNYNSYAPTLTGGGASGTWAINISGTAAAASSVAWGNVTGRPYPTTSNWQYSGQSGQPSWLWGTNDGSNMYVWNPANFSVNYATSAGSATTATTASNANAVFGLTKLGLGITGEVWYGVTGSRTFGVDYPNNRAYPIMVVVSVGWTTGGGNDLTYLVNGQVVGYESGNSSTDTGDSFGFIVPAGHSYRVNLNSGGATISNWAELY